MSIENFFQEEQIKEAAALAEKAKNFLGSAEASSYYAQRISNGVGNHREAFYAGIQSVRQDSQRFVD